VPCLRNVSATELRLGMADAHVEGFFVDRYQDPNNGVRQLTLLVGTTESDSLFFHVKWTLLL